MEASKAPQHFRSTFKCLFFLLTRTFINSRNFDLAFSIIQRRRVFRNIFFDFYIRVAQVSSVSLSNNYSQFAALDCIFFRDFSVASFKTERNLVLFKRHNFTRRIAARDRAFFQIVAENAPFLSADSVDINSNWSWLFIAFCKRVAVESELEFGQFWLWRSRLALSVD